MFNQFFSLFTTTILTHINSIDIDLKLFTTNLEYQLLLIIINKQSNKAKFLIKSTFLTFNSQLFQIAINYSIFRTIYNTHLKLAFSLLNDIIFSSSKQINGILFPNKSIWNSALIYFEFHTIYQNLQFIHLSQSYHTFTGFIPKIWLIHKDSYKKKRAKNWTRP